jgi:glycosyltransferase involved in cell wall biosynthesis
MSTTRVGIVCDLREEHWYSMDLVADMLLAHLPAVSWGSIAAIRLCPPMARRWTRVPLIGRTSGAALADRLVGRVWAYPRWLAPQAGDFDLFHIVDHSYAHLVRVLPASRTVISCHDLDAVRGALPGSRERYRPRTLLAGPILDGLALAARVVCVSEATRDELLAHRLCAADRVSVVPDGVDATCSPRPDPRADRYVDELLGPASRDEIDLLHVGSTVGRKRIDTLLEVVARLRKQIPEVRLIRVGGEFTRLQRALAGKLGLGDGVTVLPFVERAVLAALYRRASLVLLPSEREGFGLPVVEAMACGTPVVASDLPVLHEVGGAAVSYCPVGAVPRWADCVSELISEKRTQPDRWEGRRQAAITRAARFSWSAYAAGVARLYGDVLSGTDGLGERRGGAS